MYKNFTLGVSVPYRGATFLNGDYMNLKGFDVPVSVPYRGATFLNYNDCASVYETIEEGFRPLSGSYISQSESWYQ